MCLDSDVCGQNPSPFYFVNVFTSLLCYVLFKHREEYVSLVASYKNLEGLSSMPF